MTDNMAGCFKLIKAKRIIDGRAGPPIEHGAMLIEGDRIKAIGSDLNIMSPEGVQVEKYDFGDRTVLPGLIDAHVHIIGIGDGRMGDDLATLPDEVLTLQASKNARAHLYAGVTTVADCGAKNDTTVMLRQAVSMGILPSPRLVLSIRPIAIIGGHLSYFGTTATGINECRAAVRQLVNEGADFIKITATGGSTRTSFPYAPSFELDELTAICDEAHKFNKVVMAHVVCSAAIERCINADVDVLVHCGYYEPDGSFKYRPDITEKLAKKGTFLVPTLYMARQRFRELELKSKQGPLTTAETAEMGPARQRWEQWSGYWRRMHSEGVSIAAGSDSTWNRNKMGYFQGEVEAMTCIGMSNIQAIVSATSGAARACAQDCKTGSLESGKIADILVVDGDPSKNISALNNVVSVFQNGKLVKENSATK